MEHFSLTMLQKLLNGERQNGNQSRTGDEASVGNYISQHLAVAREFQPKIIIGKFGGRAMIVPEMRILILKRGWVEPTINLTPHHYEAGTLVFVGPDSVVQFKQASEDFAGCGLSMSSELFTLATEGRVPRAFDGHLRDFCLQLSPKDVDFLDSLHNLLYLNTCEQRPDSQVTLHLICSFLWFVSQRWNQHEEANRLSMNRNQRLFSEFIQLVNRDVRQQHHVSCYASQLCMTPRYFSTLIRQISGKPPKTWIDEAILTQAKIALRYSEKTVFQIAEDLQFPSTSLFCKFFKRLTGTSPLEYRQQNSDDASVSPGV